MTDQPTPDEDQPHVCKPGAMTYYCLATAKIESDCHGGFDVCCDQTELHQLLLKCSLAHLRQAHPPHAWEPQPGMSPVRCEGYSADPASSWPRRPCGATEQHGGHRFMRGTATGLCPGVEQQEDSAGLRDRYAAAIRALNEGGTLADLDEENDIGALVDAVLAVRDEELEQVRDSLARVEAIATRWEKYGSQDLRTAARILRAEVLDPAQQPVQEAS